MAYPFTLGVASGDPSVGGIVLWTRLAPEPLAPQGGMCPAAWGVDWELAADDAFQRVLRRGSVLAHAHEAHSVHVELTDLVPGAVYWDRFHCAGHRSEVGVTRTAPAICGPHEATRFALAAESLAAVPHRGTLDAIARDDLDFLVLTSTIDLDPRGLELETATRSRVDPLSAARAACARRQLDPVRRAAQRALPWIFAADGLQLGAQQLAHQAWWEHAPLRRARRAARLQAGPAGLLRWGAIVDLQRQPAARPVLGARARWSLSVATEAGTGGAWLSLLRGPGLQNARAALPQLSAPAADQASACPDRRRTGYLRCEAMRDAFWCERLLLPEQARQDSALCPEAVFQFGAPMR